MTALEAFEVIKNCQLCVNYDEDNFKSVAEYLPILCNTVETSLKRLEQIEEIRRMHVEDIDKKLNTFNVVKDNYIKFLEGKLTCEDFVVSIMSTLGQILKH